MDKAERLAQIMFEEDTLRVEEGKEPIYFNKEDYEAEKRKEKMNKPKGLFFYPLHRTNVR